MAKNDDATLVIGAGNYYWAPYDSGTPEDLPADVSVAPSSPWEDFGHTSLEEIFNLTSEGGEANTLGTLQNRSLRTTYSTRTEALNFTLEQFDEDSLKFYFGSNAALGPNGELRVPSKGEPTISSFLAIFVDGDNYFAIYAPKAEIYRNDDISVADTESFAGLPLSVKFVQHSTNDWNYAVTPLGVVES